MLVKDHLLSYCYVLLVCMPLSACPQTSQPVPQPAIASAPQYIWSLDWRPDDKIIAVAGDDSTVWLYDAGSYAVFKTFKLPGMVKCIMWHPQGKLLAAGTNKTIEIVNTETGSSNSITSAGGARSITWNPDGTMLATAHGEFTHMWTADGKLLKSFQKEHNKTLMAVTWHPTDNLIITASDEIRMWDANAGKQLKVFRHRPEELGVLTVQWHPSGKLFASGDYGHHKEGKGSLLQLWNTDGSLVKTITGSRGEYRNVRWSKDGSMLASASDALRIWTKDGNLLAEGPSSEEHIVWGLGWNSTGTRIATATFTGTVQVWDNKANLIKTISTLQK